MAVSSFTRHLSLRGNNSERSPNSKQAPRDVKPPRADPDRRLEGAFRPADSGKPCGPRGSLSGLPNWPDVPAKTAPVRDRLGPASGRAVAPKLLAAFSF